MTFNIRQLDNLDYTPWSSWLSLSRLCP